jgi:hypothetical protein
MKPSREEVKAEDTARYQGEETIQGRSKSRRYSQRPRRETIWGRSISRRYSQEVKERNHLELRRIQLEAKVKETIFGTNYSLLTEETDRGQGGETL